MTVHLATWPYYPQPFSTTLAAKKSLFDYDNSKGITNCMGHYSVGLQKAMQVSYTC